MFARDRDASRRKCGFNEYAPRRPKDGPFPIRVSAYGVSEIRVPK